MVKFEEIENVKFALTVRKGGSYFGSGCHSAGYKILQGKAIQTVIEEFDNGFTSGEVINIKPDKDFPSILVESWDFDFLNHGNKRYTGKNGLYRIFR